MSKFALSKLSKILPLVVCIVCLALTVTAWRLLENNDRKQISEVVKSNASNVQNNIEKQLDNHVRALERMASRWSERGVTPRNEWNTDAERYAKDFSGYQAVEWVDQTGHICWIVPEIGNEKALNFDLTSEPVRRAALENARSKRMTTITPNVDLVQGDKGFLVFVPIYSGDNFGGFIVGIFKTDKFISLSLPPEVRDNYAIQLLDNGSQVYRSQPTDDISAEYTASHSVNIPGVSWEIQVSPTVRTVNNLGSSAGIWTLFIGFLLSILLACIAWLAQRARLKSVETEVANRKLEKISTLQKAVLDGANYMIIATDPEGTIISFNKAAEMNLGYEAQDFIGKATPAVFHDPAEVVKRAAELSEENGSTIEPGFEVFVHNSRNRQVEEREWTYIRKDGTRFPVMLSITALRDERGNVTGFLGVGDDVTEKKRAAAEIYAAEERFKTFMNNSPVVACQKDSEGRYVFINDTMKRYFNIDVETMDGKTDFDLLPEEIACVVREKDNFVITTGQTQEFTQVVASPDGVERTWQTYKFPIYNSDGTPSVGIVAFDITVLKEAEKSLRESENRYHRQLQSSPVGIVLTDAEGGVEFVNEHWRKITGLSPEESAGVGWASAVHPDDRERIVHEWSQKSKTGEETSYEFRFLNKDGKVVEVFARALKRYNEKGDFEGHFATVADVTEIKQLQSDLQFARDAAIESARLKAEFLANMSHEIRTPMNGVIGMTDILLAGSLDDEQRDYAETIKLSADSLLTIINDILDFSKIEAGKLHFETIDFNLLHTVESTVSLFAEQARRKGIEIASFVESNINPNICGDPTRLRQVLTNLIGNAIKFTDQGEVIVRVVQESETDYSSRLKFSISDTGIGISDEARKYLFQAFTQADGSMTRKYGGTGLGLTITKKLVELMNGEINVESELGRGSVFSFTADFEKQIALPEANTVPQINLENLRILIVDDNQTNRKILVEQLAFWGTTVDEAEDGKTALVKLREAAEKRESYDIALIDLMMPGMSGFELAYLIRGDQRIDRTKLILMPSFGEPGHAQTAKENGINGYLIKPIRQSDLFNALSSLSAEDLSKDESESAMTMPTKFITKHFLKENKKRQPGLILLAEDNEVNQKVTRIQLERLGYQIDIVANGREALEASRKRPYSLILMDCQMPEMDGYQATTAIRKRDEGDRYVPIIAMTANAMQGEREKCLAAGMDDYVTKPVKVDILDRTLSQWISGKQAPQAYQQPSTADMAVVAEIPDLSEIVSLDESVLEDFRALQMPEEPDLVADLIDLFIRDTAQRMGILKAAVNNQNLTVIKKQAHTFKGSAGNVGAFRLARLGKLLEENIYNFDNIRILVAQMDSELHTVTNKLEAMQKASN